MGIRELGSSIYLVLIRQSLENHCLWLHRIFLFFFQKSNFSSNPYWENQIGMLYIYFENLIDPILVVPLNLAATLKLNYGRAWVGFTSSTGSETWQVHDILEWKFSSLRSN